LQPFPQQKDVATNSPQGGPIPLAGDTRVMPSSLTTVPSGAVAVLDANAYTSHMPQRGDIVVLHPPTDPSATFVKRVIGLPGDIIEIDGAQQSTALLIEPNGQAPFQRVRESYPPETWDSMNFCCLSNGTESAKAQPVTIPTGEYFVMGDNRNKSSDSRAFGFVVARDIIGEIVGIDGSAGDIYANRPTLVPS
jgi:signal peptidase I